MFFEGVFRLLKSRFVGGGDEVSLKRFVELG